MRRRAIILVLDGVGIGAAPDAAAYGDAGSDTLGNVARAVGGLRAAEPRAPRASATSRRSRACRRAVAARAPGAGCVPASAGKDSTTGHWEIAGVHLDGPFPTYPDGLPARGGRRVLAGAPGGASSGTWRRAARRSSRGSARSTSARASWIVYTSADSVFQVAAHEAVVPLDELYAACETARAHARRAARRVPGHRPAVRRDGRRRTQRTANRRDYSLAPPEETLLDALAAAGVPRAGVGKVDDLFAGRSLARAAHGEQCARGSRPSSSGSQGRRVGCCSPTW